MSQDTEDRRRSFVFDFDLSVLFPKFEISFNDI